MSRLGNVILLVVFWALLAAPVVLFAAGKRPENVENRTLTTMPDLTARSVLKISSWQQAATVFDDRLPYRDDIIAKRGELSYRVLRDSPNPGVLVGKGDWLFFHGDLETCAVATNPAQVAQALELLHLGYEATGRRLVYAIVPSKPEIEREHKGRTLSLEDCVRAKEHELERELSGRKGSIDLYTPMREAKARGEDVLIPTDTHAGTRGRLMIAEGIVTALDPASWASARIGVGAGRALHRRSDGPDGRALRGGRPHPGRRARCPPSPSQIPPCSSATRSSAARRPRPSCPSSPAASFCDIGPAPPRPCCPRRTSSWSRSSAPSTRGSRRGS